MTIGLIGSVYKYANYSVHDPQWREQTLEALEELETHLTRHGYSIRRDHCKRDFSIACSILNKNHLVEGVVQDDKIIAESYILETVVEAFFEE